MEIKILKVQNDGYIINIDVKYLRMSGHEWKRIVNCESDLLNGGTLVGFGSSSTKEGMVRTGWHKPMFL